MVGLFFKHLGAIKRIASLLLLVCIFLPLSKCDGETNLATGKQDPDKVFYGSELIQSSVEDLATGSTRDLGFFLIVLTVFLAPVATLAARRFWEPLLLLAASGFAGYFLFYWVIAIPNHVMIGGGLAIAAWLVLIMVSIAQLIELRRRIPMPPALSA
ncbi:hypothetical protein [Massilia sp. CF038]|uniref:hypothetical protein n=1 Tax=Massilia sp. CF038 TaxID=1881045 RepID=UPI0009100A64|nr:hypothetical protein [Massilia sp. CF038]SHH01946.1 hypothetical protein SAMN05428948_2355 [Massilia sp. CF038]